MRNLRYPLFGILSFYFGEECARIICTTLLLALVLALFIRLCYEVVVYVKRAGDRASLKGFWRFHKKYPAEEREKAQARRKERAARKEARCKEKDQQKENKD